MASLVTPKRDCQCCLEGKGVCNGEVVAITTPLSREVFVRCAPLTIEGTVREQAAKFYNCLPRLLANAGVSLHDVILERVFFRDVAADFDTFAEVREAFYGDAGIQGDHLPAASYINQPPCNPDQAFELQVQAVGSQGDQRIIVESFPTVEQGCATKIIQLGDLRHLYISNINGAGPGGDISDDFREQSDAMFEKSARLLEAHGVPWPKVLRTWCYMDDIDRDYDAFNLSRNEFFEEHGVKRLPASTGIRAGLYPPAAMCGFDLYALMNPDGIQVEVMHTPTLNEADEYGSAFSRGMKVVLPEKTVLYISGTASVDEVGDTVHLDDIRKQVERMLVNVRELLRPHDSSFADAVQVITYLKRSEYLPVFQELWKEWGLEGLPNTFVEAGVCRPDLLCEMEAIMMIPQNGNGRPSEERA